MQTQSPSTANPPADAIALTSAEFEALATHVKHSTRRLKWWVRALFGIMSLACLVALYWYWWGSMGRALLVVIAVEFTILVICCALAYATRKDANEVQRLITFVEDTQDVRQLGAILPLCETLGYPANICTQVKKASNEAVPRLLLLIRSTDTDVLNSQQRSRLRYNMFPSGFTQNVSYWQRSEYRLVVLSALLQIGDKRDLPDVERLLKDLNITDEVRAAAERCAQAIRERIARENLKDVLLRPDRNPDAPATLLRPFAERADTAPQQLLRASASDDTEPPV